MESNETATRRPRKKGVVSRMTDRVKALSRLERLFADMPREDVRAVLTFHVQANSGQVVWTE